MFNFFTSYGIDSEILIPNLSDPKLIIYCSSSEALPSWKLACRASIGYKLPDFLNGNLEVQSFPSRVHLDRYVMLKPETFNFYSLRLIVPFWFNSMNIKIWSSGEMNPEFIKFENIARFPVGSAIYLADDGSYQLADCRYEASSRVIGLIFQSDPGVILTDGILYAESEDWIIATGDPIGLNPSRVYFLREAGTLSTIPPGNDGEYVVRLGTAQSIRAFEISIEPPLRL